VGERLQNDEREAGHLTDETKKNRTPKRRAVFFWFAQHGCYLDGESPLQDAIQEEENRPELLARGKGVPAMVGLKEARGKIPSQRTETSYKASPSDKPAK